MSLIERAMDSGADAPKPGARGVDGPPVHEPRHPVAPLPLEADPPAVVADHHPGTTPQAPLFARAQTRFDDLFADPLPATPLAPAGRTGNEPRPVIPLLNLDATRFVAPARENSMSRQFRNIKRTLVSTARFRSLDGADEEASNLILVTSSLPREGKTFVSINLAISLSSELDTEVVLIDADVIARGVERELGLPLLPGLTEVLRGTHEVEDVLLDTDIPNLRLMCAGAAIENLDEVVVGGTAKSVFRALAFQPRRIVILDTPPILVRSETQLYSENTGQVVFVIAARATPRDIVQESLSLLADHPNVSLVLNKSTDRLNYFAGAYDYYYSSN